MEYADADAMALDCTVVLSKGLSDFADMVLNPVLEEEVTRLFTEAGHRVGAVAPAPPPGEGSIASGRIRFGGTGTKNI